MGSLELSPVKLTSWQIGVLFLVIVLMAGWLPFMNYAQNDFSENRLNTLVYSWAANCLRMLIFSSILLGVNNAFIRKNVKNSLKGSDNGLV